MVSPQLRSNSNDRHTSRERWESKQIFKICKQTRMCSIIGKISPSKRVIINISRLKGHTLRIHGLLDLLKKFINFTDYDFQ